MAASSKRFWFSVIMLFLFWFCIWMEFMNLQIFKPPVYLVDESAKDAFMDGTDEYP